MSHGGNSHQRRKARRLESRRRVSWREEAIRLWGYVPRSATEVAILNGAQWGKSACFDRFLPPTTKDGHSVELSQGQEAEKQAQSARQLRRLFDISRDVSSSSADTELRRLMQEGVTAEIANRIAEIRAWKRSQGKEARDE